jgi:hypothetical protein
MASQLDGTFGQDDELSGPQGRRRRGKEDLRSATRLRAHSGRAGGHFAGPLG